MVRITTEDDLGRRLAGLPDVLAKGITVKAVRAGAEPIRSRAAALAPRSAHPKRPELGHLADHIVISSTRRVDGRPLGPGEVAVAVGPAKGYFWGGIEEFGTHDGRVPAHPFMRPALDGGADAAISAVLAALWEGLRAAAESGVGAIFAPSTPGSTGLL